jgi:DNA-binding CsgD family transcriptional regulator
MGRKRATGSKNSVTDQAQLELIAAIHIGVVETTPWESFVRGLRIALQGHSANLVLREADAAPDELFAVEDYQTPPVPDWKQRYFEECYRDDPFPYFKMTSGAVYGLPDLLGGEAPEDSRFFTGYLRPLGISDLLLFHASEPGGCRAWVTIARGPEGPGFTAAELALCRVLASQLGGALQVFAVMQNERMRRQLYEHAARQLNVDFLLLDGQGQLLWQAAQAKRMQAAGLRLGADGRVHARDPCFDAALQRAVAQALDGKTGDLLHIADRPYLDVFVTPIALVQPPYPALGRETPAIVVYLHAGPIQVVSGHLERLFGLSRTEARLAAALTRGRTLTEAAHDIGVTEQTARRYSKLIFSKTGANRQSELIRRILGSGAILARNTASHMGGLPRGNPT